MCDPQGLPTPLKAECSKSAGYPTRWEPDPKARPQETNVVRPDSAISPASAATIAACAAANRAIGGKSSHAAVVALQA